MDPLDPVPASGGNSPDGVKERVRLYILDNFLMGGSEVVIQDDTSFMDTSILDSIGFIEIITFLEECYDIEVLDEEMVPENLDSLRSIEAFVARKRGR